MFKSNLDWNPNDSYGGISNKRTISLRNACKLFDTTELRIFRAPFMCEIGYTYEYMNATFVERKLYKRYDDTLFMRTISHVRTQGEAKMAEVLVSIAHEGRE